MDLVEPEKEHLEFHIDPGQVPAELSSTVQAIKQAAEKVLFRWKKFPLRLPPPVFHLPPALLRAEGEARKTRTTSLRDVFTMPNFEEADAVARDAKGRAPRLDQTQLRSIRECGEFEVASRAFPGRQYRWRLSRLVQSGRQCTRRHWLHDVAFALRLLVVTARNRLDSHFLSLRASWVALTRALLLLMDALVGMPSVSASLLASRLQEERVKHLVAELTIEADTESQLEQLCLFVRYQIKRQTFEKCHMGEERLPAVPYVYKTPKGQVIDLRLYNTELLRGAMPFLVHTLEKELRGWFPSFRETLLAKLRAKKLSDADMEKQAKVAAEDEYLRRVSEAVCHDAGLESLSQGLGRLLADQAHAAMLTQRALDVVRDRTNHYLAQEKARLEEDFPVLSLIGPWLRSHLSEVQAQLEREHGLEAHETALALCRERGLWQAAYFLARDLSFLREQAPALEAELARLRAPTRTFAWRTHVWRPSHWQVRRVGVPPAECPPRAAGGGETLLLGPASERPTYVVEKQSSRLTSTRWALWRWGNFCHRTWAHTCNAMFLLGVLIPWCSPLSLRSLFLPRPFMPDFEVNQESGRLQPRKSSSTQTLCSRLHWLWRHISKSRTDFESQPDSGFVGKGLSRHLNRVWNYLVKGLCGTVLLVVLFPALCLIVCTLSLVAALLAPLWMPCMMLLFHLVMVLAYDFDSPSPERNRICVLGEALVWQGLLQGLLQPVAAAVVALVLCPLAAGLVLLVAVVRWAAVQCWDAVLFHAVVKRRARVPLGDSWMVMRVAGPGLSQDHLYQVSPEQALAAFLAKLEFEQLSLYVQQTELQILQPLHTYTQFVEQCFGPFAATLARDRGPYKDLEAELNNMVSALKAEVDKRKRELQLGLGVSCRQRTRMAASDLQGALAAGANLAQQLLPRLPASHWKDRGLEEKDWLGLAAQLYSEVFCPEFLVPLVEGDVAFRLEAVDVDLLKYRELSQVHASADLDVSRVMHFPKGKVHFHAPYLDLSVFNPQSSLANMASTKTKRAPWKRESSAGERPSLPPSVPHPAKIALIIFNRENEDPIPLDSDACQQILRAVCSGGGNADAVGSSGASSSSPSVSLQMAPSAEDISLEPRGQRATYTHSGPYSTCV